jgi:hypothetical protein
MFSFWQGGPARVESAAKQVLVFENEPFSPTIWLFYNRLVVMRTDSGQTARQDVLNLFRF